ncbi:MAG: TonB-dependent receptor [Tannerella sp.]|jgi:TonB-linked SusC/RagA family outer membrane protein|nr:TonB-dependent receptor [Tannerella sp.]
MNNFYLSKPCGMKMSQHNHRLTIFRVMKISLFLFFFCTVAMFAENAHSQNARVTIKQHNVPLEIVLNEIENQTDYLFLYNGNQINVAEHVSVNVKNMPVNQLLKDLFLDSRVKYVMEGTHIVLSAEGTKSAEMPTAASRQTLTVTGIVTDAEGVSLPGVNVTVKGATLGVITDLDGKYSIAVPDKNAVLAFSYVGFVSGEFIVGDRTVLNVTLEEDILKIDEVVVIGYGSLPKRSVTTAISSINADKVKEMPVGTLGEALYGQMTGLYLVQNDGQPGSAPSMRIRGTGSLTASSEPLFVIDGYPTDNAEVFANLSAESIESIQVLKDAASAAIYGSRAGNGVILVTTKKGSKGSYPVINVNATAGFQQPQRYIDVLNAAEFAQMVKDARAFRGMPELSLLDDPNQWKETDWQKEYFRTAPTQRYEVSARGASDRVNYSLSLNYSDQQGIVHNSFNKRIGARLQIDAELSKYVSVGASITPTWTSQRRQTTTGGNTSVTAGTISEVLTYMPLYSPYMPNGDYFQIQQHTSGTDFNSELTNPLSKIHEIDDDYTRFRTISQGFINVRPVKGLVAKSEFNFSTNNGKREFYRSAYSPGSSRRGNKSTPRMDAIDASRRSTFGYDWYWSNTITYNHAFNEIHNLTALFAYDVTYQSDYEVRQTTRTDASYPVAFGNDLIRNVAGAYLWNGESENTEYVSDAIVGRINYDYKSKYLLSASVRQDRSSKFGPDKRAGIFWSTSVGYNISEESWMKDIKWLTVAKARASYGVTGNDRIGGNYAWTSAMSTVNYAFGSGNAVNSVTGYFPGGYSNPLLSWEKNTQFDMGVDLGLFNRLSVNIDYYTRLSDAVLSVSIPNLNGKTSSVTMNAGEIRNRGVEIQLNSPIIDKNFKWTAGFNISFNRNKLLSLATGNDYYGSATGMVRNYVGRALGDMYLYTIVGTFNTPEEVQTLPKYNVQGLGDLRFKDVSGPEGVPDGKVTTDDMEFKGNNMPEFNAGFTSRMSYKNFDFSFVLDGQYGGLIYWSAASYGLNRHMENAAAIYSRNRWRMDFNTGEVITVGDGKSQVAGSGNVGTYLASSDRYLFNSNYLKIRNIALGYAIPQSFAKKIGVKGLRVNVNAQNLWSFDEYPGYSIEDGGMGGSTGGSGGGNYPIPRVITFGLNLSF